MDTQRVVVWHSGAGCDTGCCGHTIEIDGTQGYQFEFEHAEDGEMPIEFAQRLVRSTYGELHVADLDWERCEVVSYGDCPNS